MSIWIFIALVCLCVVGTVVASMLLSAGSLYDKDMDGPL